MNLAEQDLTPAVQVCTFMYTMAKGYGTITAVLKQAISSSGLSFKRLEQVTGVTRQIIMGFVKDKRTIRLDAVEKLASYFDLELRPKRKGR